MVKKFLLNTIFIGLSSSLSKIVLFIFLPLLTSSLSTLEFGFLDLITTIIELCYPLLTLGITDAILRFAVNDVNNRKSVFTYTLFIYFFSSVIFIVVSYLFVDFFGKINILALNIMYLTYVFRLLSSQVTKSLNKIKLLSLSNLFFSLVFSILFLIFNYYDNISIIIYALIFGVSNFIAGLVSLSNRECLKYFTLEELDINVMFKMINYGKWLIPNSISWWLLSWSNRLLIISFLGVNSLGIYSVAFRVSGVVNLLTLVLQQSWQLTALKEYNNITSNKKFILIFNSLIIFMSFIGIILNFCGIYIIETFFSNEYFNASSSLPFLLTASLYGLFSMFFGTAYLIVKDSKAAMTTTIIGGIFSFFISIPLIYYKGISGVAFSVCIGYLIIMLLRFKEGKSVFNIKDDHYFPFKYVMLFLLINSIITIYFQKSLIVLFTSLIILVILNFNRIKYILCFSNNEYNEK